jgi:transcriptional regulator with XRE-family HTH domain
MKKAGKSKFDLLVIGLVKTKREKLGLKQEDIARFLDVDRSYIGHIESPLKKAKYNLNHLNRLAFEMDCSPKDFLPDRGFEEKTFTNRRQPLKKKKKKL